MTIITKAIATTSAPVVPVTRADLARSRSSLAIILIAPPSRPFAVAPPQR